MRHLIVFVIGLIFLAGCDETEAPMSEPLTLEEQLLEVMKMPLATGTGKVVRTVNYCCEPRRPSAILDSYYPVGGGVRYLVHKSAAGDTLEISLQNYKDEKLQSSHAFRYRSGMSPEWTQTAEFSYDLEGKLIERYTVSPERPRTLALTYQYDANDRLTGIESPAGNGVETLRYAYDEQGRIAREWRHIKTQEEFEIDYMFYRYEGERLVAKEATQYGRLEGQRQDWHRYIYDEQGRLVAQFEFDPHLFFQRKNYAEFFYE